MMTQEELKILLTLDESYRIERTVSIGNMDKFQEAICAFSNDMPNSRKHGYLLIGVYDDGRLSGLKVDDALMIKISSIRSDGNILPLPVMTTEKVSMPDGDVLVVDVTPSLFTPTRYRGRTFVRVGPRKDIASIEEERILTERCAASLPTFDTYPCREAKLDDLHFDTIAQDYFSQAVAEDVLKQEHRSLEEQMASLRLYNRQWNCPTYAAIVLFGKRPEYFLPGCYLQYVRFRGKTNGGEILNERAFRGPLYKILPLLEGFIRDAIVTKRPIPVSVLRERDVHNYPYKALRELLMNACMHRDYQSNMPIRIYQYDDRIEIMNPGGLYGLARPENFPRVNDYRNSVIAEVLRTLHYVNKFNHGIQEVQELLEANGNPQAQFDVDLVTVFQVRVEDANITAAEDDLKQACSELIQNFSDDIKLLIIRVEIEALSAQRLQLVMNLSQMNLLTFRRQYLMPLLDCKVLELTIPDRPRSPKQKYQLTKLGRMIARVLREKNEN